MLFTFVLEDRFIYYPEREYAETPKDLGVPFEDVWIKTGDGFRIHGWWIGDDKLRTTVLFFHGNAGNISHRIDRLRALAPLPCRFLLLDYRGYGASEGAPSESGLYEDARAAYEFLVKEKKLSPEQIILFGESLGGAVAIDLAARFPVAKVIAESTFTSLHEMAAILMPYIPSAMIQSRFDSLGKIKNIRAPLLVVHGERDDLVPISMGKTLWETALEPKEFIAVSGAGHNDVYIMGGSDYRDSIQKFLVKVPSR